MANTWPTQQQDMQVAEAIIHKYKELNEGEPLSFIEVIVDKETRKPVEIKMPDWISEMLDHFYNRYGYEQGQAVASKVITRVLLRDETIH